jgi:SAM-dependent methyltransferase
MPAASPDDDRLDFQLPDFTRVAWVSEAARAVWQPRIAAISRAWPEVEWRSVSDGVRACTLIRQPKQELLASARRWLAHVLEIEQLQIESGDRSSYQNTVQMPKPGQPTVICAALGRRRDVAEFRRAWKKMDDDKLGELFGYPACCRRFFSEVWVRQQRRDTTWAMAAGDRQGSSDRTMVVAGSRSANILWRWMGVRLVPHLPCGFACAATHDLAEKLRRVALDAGYAREYGWIDQILDWSVEWSALHGIAEIKTPILKVISRTDATAGKYVVQRTGSAAYPEEGSRGLHFPYRLPARRPVADSRSYALGLANPTASAEPTPDWYHRDNGFVSRIVMDRLHRPIVTLAQRATRERAGNVIDLGCGNGALLAKICRGGDLTPFGIDCNAAAIEHAKTLQPDHAENFLRGDFFTTGPWADGRRFALAILMIGRLLEVPPEGAQGLMKALRACCEELLVYVYPNWSRQSFGDILSRLGLHGVAGDGERVALVSLSGAPPAQQQFAASASSLNR